MLSTSSGLIVLKLLVYLFHISRLPLVSCSTHR